jgi:2-polyprenyl-3-methyl-5-hydroxy-6-metoxy-1,4-benzoquinol methylase
MIKERVPCNLCGGTDFLDVVKSDRYGMGLSTVMCKYCGFLFTNPRPIEAEMDRFYREHYRDFYFSIPDPNNNDYLISDLRNTAVKRAEWLFNFVEEELEALSMRPATVLDVGCGDGAFLSRVRSKIAESKLFGIEPSRLYARFAVRSSRANVYTGNIVQFCNERKSQSAYFNLIVLSHVLEHLYNPMETIAMLRELLEPEGLLCVEIPNLLSSHWQGYGMFHIAHISHFTPGTIRFLFSKGGFRLIKEFTDKHPVDPWAMTYLFKKDDSASLNSFPEITTDESKKVLRHVKDRVCRKDGVINQQRSESATENQHDRNYTIFSLVRAGIKRVLKWCATKTPVRRVSVPDKQKPLKGG